MLCDVNQKTGTASARYPQAKKFTDLRRVFDGQTTLTRSWSRPPSSTHAFATYLALTHGKHVYCEKPLAYNIWETRLIRETAAKYPKLSTQMVTRATRRRRGGRIKEILITSVIGPVHEVHVWAERAWGLQDAASAQKFDKQTGFYNGIQITERSAEQMPTRRGKEWDLWLGPAPERPYHATYFPGPRGIAGGISRRTMSDLGSHDNDVPFTVLNL